MEGEIWDRPVHVVSGECGDREQFEGDCAIRIAESKPRYDLLQFRSASSRVSGRLGLDENELTAVARR